MCSNFLLQIGHYGSYIIEKLDHYYLLLFCSCRKLIYCWVTFILRTLILGYVCIFCLGFAFDPRVHFLVLGCAFYYCSLALLRFQEKVQLGKTSSPNSIIGHWLAAEISVGVTFQWGPWNLALHVAMSELANNLRGICTQNFRFPFSGWTPFWGGFTFFVLSSVLFLSAFSFS